VFHNVAHKLASREFSIAWHGAMLPGGSPSSSVHVFLPCQLQETWDKK